MKKIILILLIIMLYGCAIPFNDSAIDQTECPDCPVSSFSDCQGSSVYSIAYVNNCDTGEIDKYICKAEEGCKSTEEILSELG